MPDQGPWHAVGGYRHVDARLAALATCERASGMLVARAAHVLTSPISILTLVLFLFEAELVGHGPHLVRHVIIYFYYFDCGALMPIGLASPSLPSSRPFHWLGHRLCPPHYTTFALFRRYAGFASPRFAGFADSRPHCYRISPILGHAVAIFTGDEPYWRGHRVYTSRRLQSRRCTQDV